MFSEAVLEDRCKTDRLKEAKDIVLCWMAIVSINHMKQLHQLRIQ